MLRFRIMSTTATLSNSELHVNGAARLYPVMPTVAELLLDMGLAGKRVAIERNGEIVPRAHYGELRLVAGDRVEVVIAVGGG